MREIVAGGSISIISAHDVAVNMCRFHAVNVNSLKARATFALWNLCRECSL